MSQFPAFFKRLWAYTVRWVSVLGRFCFFVAGAVATAWLFVWSYPSYSHSFFAWFALAPFILCISKIRGFKSAVFYSWLTGILCNAGLLSWIYYTCVHGGGMSTIAALGAWLGLAALLAVQFAIFGGGCYFLKKTGFFFPLLAACGWVALEWLHQTIAFYGLGFPWVMLGYTQWNVPEVLYLASYTGVYGISFILAFTGACVGWGFALPGIRQGLWQFFAGTLLFACVFGFGKYQTDRRLAWEERGRPQSLLNVQAALLQPNIDQYKKWTPEYEQEIRQTLQQMGNSLAGQSIYLAVWPESVVPDSLNEENSFNLFAGIGQKSGAYQILGANIFEENRQYVGAYLMAPQTADLSSYRKVKLVPFGEFIPLESLVRKITANLEVMGSLGAFTPGDLTQPLLEAGGIKLGTTVCYESIFPQLWRAQRKAGAQLFVNITNDAWFFQTAAPYQHLAVNVLRAVENGIPVLRAANTGFSAYIDAHGVMRAQSGLFTQEILTASVPLSVRDKETFYTHWGDWFAWVCALVFFTIGISTIVFFYEEY